MDLDVDAEVMFMSRESVEAILDLDLGVKYSLNDQLAYVIEPSYANIWKKAVLSM